MGVYRLKHPCRTEDMNSLVIIKMGYVDQAFGPTDYTFFSL